jgi:3-oxocholest-4-en-26-oate---CoA ligase
LLAQPGVTDASVVGLPDETWGERVVAVVATPSATLTERQLKDALRRRLAGYKVPRSILLLPALPRTPAGKLELAQIRRLASGEPPELAQLIRASVMMARRRGVPSTHIAD